MPASLLCAQTACMSSAPQSSGFFAGENPSRNHASACPFHVRQRLAGHRPRSRPTDQSRKFSPPTVQASMPPIAHRVCRQTPRKAACACAMSARLSGNASNELNANVPSGARAANADHATSRFKPVPKPNSAILKPVTKPRWQSRCPQEKRECVSATPSSRLK